MFNHTSWVDAPAIMWLLCPSGVSKASNADIPLIGTCIKAYQNIYVPRESIDAKKTPATTSSPANGAPTKSVATLIAERWAVECHLPAKLTCKGWSCRVWGIWIGLERQLGHMRAHTHPHTHTHTHTYTHTHTHAGTHAHGACERGGEGGRERKRERERERAFAVLGAKTLVRKLVSQSLH